MSVRKIIDMAVILVVTGYLSVLCSTENTHENKEVIMICFISVFIRGNK